MIDPADRILCLALATDLEQRLCDDSAMLYLKRGAAQLTAQSLRAWATNHDEPDGFHHYRGSYLRATIGTAQKHIEALKRREIAYARREHTKDERRAQRVGARAHPGRPLAHAGAGG